MNRPLLAGWRLAWILAALAPLPSLAIEAALLEAPPYGFDRRGTPAGAYVDIVRAIAAESGHSIHITLVPFARAIASVNTGSDTLTLMFDNSRLAHKASRGALITQIDSVIVSGRGTAIDSIDKLASLKIGRMRGGCQDIERRFGNAVFHELDDHRQGARLLNAGRIDAICSTRGAIFTAFAAEGLPAPLASDVRVTSRREVWLFTAAAMPAATREQLNRAADALRARGEIERILERWGEASATSRLPGS